MGQLWAQVTPPAGTHTHTPGVASPEPSRRQGQAEAKAPLEASQARLHAQTRAPTLPLPKA